MDFMSRSYYRRAWTESRGDQWDSWGPSVYLFETDGNGIPVRQIEQYASGPTLRYGPERAEDDYGFLSSEPLEADEWIGFAITESEFEIAWAE
jgi:hypothetical protein